MPKRLLAALSIVVTITGCTKELPSPHGVQIKGTELKEFFSGTTIHGYSTARNRGFVERYRADGQYDIAFSTNRNSTNYGRRHSGTWRIEGDRVCYRVPSLKSDGCVLVYDWYSKVEFVSLETGKVVFYSSDVERKEEKLAPTIATPSTPPATAPPVAAAPAPSTPQPAAPRQPSDGLKPVGSGSGFIVSNQTYVLTNWHVADDCRAVTIRLDDRDIAAAISARDPQNDLALLRLPLGEYPVAVFQTSNMLYPGDTVVAIGYPLRGLLADEASVSVGTVSALAGLRNDTSRLQISAPVQPGNSGGPLLDMSGHVIGVIVSKLDAVTVAEVLGDIPQNINFAIKSQLAMSFLRASGVSFKAENGNKALSAANVARRARLFTVPVDCWQ